MRDDLDLGVLCHMVINPFAPPCALSHSPARHIVCLGALPCEVQDVPPGTQKYVIRPITIYQPGPGEFQILKY